MKFTILPILAGLSSLVSAKTTAADTSIPKSTDAHSYISSLYSGSETATPTWATGKYLTKLATALYSVETSFAGRADYVTIVDDIWSAAEKHGGSKVVASMSTSGYDWSDITTNGWYKDNMPGKYQTEVANYDKAWDSAWAKVEAQATATRNGAAGAAAARCTGAAVVGAAALGVAAVAGVM